jgi:hypothetical protein
MPLGCLTLPTGDDDDDDDDGDDSGEGASDGSGAGDPGEGGSSGETTTSGGGSCDPSAFVDYTYWTPNGVVIDGQSVFYQVKLSSDGTYQKEMMIGTSNLWCDHGTWQMPDCGTVEFQSACDGNVLQQSFSSDGSTMVLEGIEMEYYEYGTFLCGPTEC